MNGKGKGVKGQAGQGGKGVGHVENMRSASEQCNGKIRKISDIIKQSRPNDMKISSVIAGSASCLSSVQDKLRFLQQAETLVTSALFPKSALRACSDTGTGADIDESDDGSSQVSVTSVQDDHGTIDAIIAMQALQSTQIAVSEVITSKNNTLFFQMSIIMQQIQGLVYEIAADVSKMSTHFTQDGTKKY